MSRAALADAVLAALDGVTPTAGQIAGRIRAVLDAGGDAAADIYDAASSALTEQQIRAHRLDTIGRAEAMWGWFGQPYDGPESLLMVVTNDVNGLAYRPLLALSRPDAEQLAPHAKGAADALGVHAVLREYECVKVEALAVVPMPPPEHASTARIDDDGYWRPGCPCGWTANERTLDEDHALRLGNDHVERMES